MAFLLSHSSRLASSATRPFQWPLDAPMRTVSWLTVGHPSEIVMRFLAAMLLFNLLPLSVMAATPTTTGDPVVTAIHTLSPDATVSSLSNGPLPGMVTAIASGDVLYVSKDGRYVLQGHLYDLKRGLDLTEQHNAADRAKVLASMPPKDLIVMRPAQPRYRVIAFVDTDCGYCQQLVANVDDYLAKGIEIDFASWPRLGADASNPSYRQAVDIWCSKDRIAALRSTFAGHPALKASCANPVASQAKVATSLQLAGTPAILAPDGALLGGLVSPEELAKRLALLPHQ